MAISTHVYNNFDLTFSSQSLAPYRELAAANSHPLPHPPAIGWNNSKVGPITLLGAAPDVIETTHTSTASPHRMHLPLYQNHKNMKHEVHKKRSRSLPSSPVRTKNIMRASARSYNAAYANLPRAKSFTTPQRTIRSRGHLYSQVYNTEEKETVL